MKVKKGLKAKYKADVQGYRKRAAGMYVKGRQMMASAAAKGKKSATGEALREVGKMHNSAIKKGQKGGMYNMNKSNNAMMGQKGYVSKLRKKVRKGRNIVIGAGVVGAGLYARSKM